MNNLAENLESIIDAEADSSELLECDFVSIGPEGRESLSENFISELETWARRCLASNGFGDF